MITPSTSWRVVVWPDQGHNFIEWCRDEPEARSFFLDLVNRRVPCALVKPDGVLSRFNPVDNYALRRPAQAAA